MLMLKVTHAVLELIIRAFSRSQHQVFACVGATCIRIPAQHDRDNNIIVIIVLLTKV